jgi:hypothetical protein
MKYRKQYTFEVKHNPWNPAIVGHRLNREQLRRMVLAKKRTTDGVEVQSLDGLDYRIYQGAIYELTAEGGMIQRHWFGT